MKTVNSFCLKALLAVLTLGLVSFAQEASAAPRRDCSKVAYAAARSLDSISNSARLNSYRLVSAKKIKQKRMGGETHDTYLVHMTANEDMATIWEVEVSSSFCLVQSARFVTGD